LRRDALCPQLDVDHPRCSAALPLRVGAHRDAVLKKRVMVRGLPSEAVLYSVVRPAKVTARMRNEELANSSVQPAPEDGRG
jgi:hypothetical protein